MAIVIPFAEIQEIVEGCVNARLFTGDRGPRSGAFDRADLINEAWIIALEALPNQRKSGAPLGPYVGRAIMTSLRNAIARWGKARAHDAGPDWLDQIPDPAPSAEQVMLARAEASRALSGLSQLDREIVGELLGAGDKPGQPEPAVARHFGVPVGRVYQARQMLSRRAGVRGVPRPGRFYNDGARAAVGV